MQISNDTPFPIELARDATEEVTSLRVRTRVLYGWASESSQLLREHAPPEAEAVPWPRAELGTARHDVQVVVLGEIRGSDKPFTRRDLRLRACGREERLAVFGPRSWQRGSGGALVASEPAPTDAVVMTWDLAYGGCHRLPPGMIEGTGLPGPSSEVAWPANPGGIGFYRREEDAVGQTLPQIEDPTSLVTRWDDRPVPVCWAPLPAQSNLRIEHWIERDGRLGVEGDPEPPPELDTQAMVPRRMRFPLQEGDRIELEGFGPEARVATVPVSPFEWHARAGERHVRYAPRLTHVALLPNAEMFACFYETRVHVPLVRHEVRAAAQRMSPTRTDEGAAP